MPVGECVTCALSRRNDLQSRFSMTGVDPKNEAVESVMTDEKEHEAQPDKEDETSRIWPRYCSYCGARLEVARISWRYWVTFWQCPKEPYRAYLEQADMRFVYALATLDSGIMKRVLEADEEVLEEALKLIRPVDHKTVSIVAFERKMLGIADDVGSR